VESKGKVVSIHQGARRRSSPPRPSAESLLDEFVTIMSMCDPDQKKILFAEWSMRVFARKGELPSQKAQTTRQT